MIHGSLIEEQVLRSATLRQQLRSCERQLILDALGDAGGRVEAAAKRLGIHRGHLHRRMRELGIARVAQREHGGGDPVMDTLGAIERGLRAREEREAANASTGR